MSEALVNPADQSAPTSPTLPISRPVSAIPPSLPTRDWLLIPLLAILTIAFLAISTELTARHLYSETQKTLASCLVLNDPSTGPRGIPNSVCKEKNAEAGWIETRLDSHGYRNDFNPTPKPPSVFRIVLTGSSVSLGERVQREESFAAQLPGKLSSITGRPIQLYNESLGFKFARNTDQQFGDVLSASPDLILWVFTPIDIESASFTLPDVNVKQWNSQSLATKAWRRVAADFASQDFSAAASGVLGRTRAALMLRHWLYQNQSEYVKSYLMESDSNAGFLKASLSPAWQRNLNDFAQYASDMEQRSTAAGIPFVASMIPNRAQTILISTGDWPPVLNPNHLDTELGRIITSHGGIYLNLSQDFRAIPNPGRLYLPVDGHPNAVGHAVLATLLAKELSNGSVPALAQKQIPAAESPTAAQQPEPLK